MANFLKSLFVKGVEIDPAGATSNQVLKYNGTKFVPGTASTVGSIDDLSDVVISTPSNSQILQFNGTNWVNSAGTAGPNTAISDTPPASPVTGQLWYESDTGLAYVYYDSFWIEIGGGSSYDTVINTIQAKGDLLAGTASQTLDRLTVGTNNQRLIANSSATTGLSWANDATNTVIDTKGDLLVGATNDVVAKLPVGTNNQVLVADSTATNGLAWVDQPTGFRNVLINGEFRINQRAYASASNLASGSYGFDRWKSSFTNTTLTFTSAPQGQIVTINSGGSIKQVVERENITAGTFVLSWTGTATGRVYNTGATPPAYAASPIIVTLDGLANVEVEFTASGGTQTLWKPQLEQNRQPTPFEQRPIGVELALCQRYFWKLITNGISYLSFQYAGTQYRLTIPHPVQMRINPHTVSTSTWQGGTTPSLAAASVLSTNWSTTNGWFYVDSSTSIEISAEL